MYVGFDLNKSVNSSFGYPCGFVYYSC